MGKPWRKVLLGAAALVVAYLACAPIEAEPLAWTPPEADESVAPWSSPRALQVTRMLEGEGRGPEDVAVDAQGRVYTGYEDGRIVRFVPDRAGPPELFATLPGGRPLGMEFDAAGTLLVADGRAGIVGVSPEGTVRTIVDTVDGEPLVFADDLDVTSDGTIWFSEASRRWDVQDAALDAIEGVPTGRLIAHDPATGRTKVALSQLRYANGVSVTPDDEAVLVNETFGYRVTRLWLKGPKAGSSEVFVDALPGLPDNVEVDAQGNVWVALVKARSPILDAVYPYPALRGVFYRIPESWLPVPPPIVWVAAFDAEGTALASMRAEDGFGDITSATPHGDTLWLGSLTMSALGSVPRPDL
ncbi:MAG: SMP-30/gluconolactonase/LRE family protein [Myxococcota bacterium]